MEKDYIVTQISLQEIWHPTMNLRQLQTENPFFISDKLQQLFISNLGNKEWRDVPTVTE